MSFVTLPNFLYSASFGSKNEIFSFFYLHGDKSCLLIIHLLNAVNCNLTELTTKSTCVSLVVSGVDTYAHMLEFHVLVDCSLVNVQEAFFLWLLVVWQVIAQAVTIPPLSLPLSTVWLGCQDLPAMGSVFIKELAANSGSSWMSQAPNLHFSKAVVNRK